MLVQVKNVSKIFNERSLPVTALSDVSLSVEEGEFAALSGPSGSGKTTLLNLIGCLDRPTSGSVRLDGEEVNGLSQQALTQYRLTKIGFIFQDYNLIPTLTAAENMEYVLWLQGMKTPERKKCVQKIAGRFGIANLLGRRPSELSRGQQQRVAIGRAIAHRPKIVLGDELTANLDHKTGTELMDFLKELNRTEKVTFLYATHDPVMLDRAQRVVKMQDGKLLEKAQASA